ncbi:MAG: ABC transporter permease [Spirochaetia bacterium]
MFAIFKREFKSYFLTTTGYIYMSLFLLIAGIFFLLVNLFPQDPRFSGFLESIIFIFLISVPILTMRLMTDEAKYRTDQLLFTSPLKITDIVLGKYFAAIALFLITMAVTAIWGIMISFFGEVDWSETIAAYTGFILMGFAFISVGLFISSTTENQVVAAIVTFGALLVTWIIDFIQQGVPTTMGSGIVFTAIVFAGIAAWVYFSTKNWIITAATVLVGAGVIILVYFLAQEFYFGLISKSLNWFSLIQRYEGFRLGTLRLDAIIYYLTFSSFFIFLTVRHLEKRRWK